jgi:hypothetical protein
MVAYQDDSPKSVWDEDLDDEGNEIVQEGDEDGSTATCLEKAIPLTDPAWLTRDVRRLRFPWTVWFHFPHDTNWTIDSYTKLCTFDTLEMMLAVMKSIETISTNCMVFVMKDDIQPLWEHERNKGGGAFSYKIPEANTLQFWNGLVFLVVGDTLIDCAEKMAYANGVTISPKKNFHIMKIWFAACSDVETLTLNDEMGVVHEGRVYSAF